MVTEQLRYADDVELLDFPVRENLTWKEKKQAELLKTINRGVMLVTGEAGSGKDLFGHALAAKNKYYFSDLVDPSKPRKVLLDVPPKKAFGEYIPFDSAVMMKEISKMAKAAKMGGVENSKDQKEVDQFIEEETGKWLLEGKGQMLFKGAFLYLEELKNYCYNREPHRLFNKYIGKLCDVHRHLDMLIVGTHIREEEIDVNTFLSKTTHRAKCFWSLSMPNTTQVKIARGRYYVGSNVWNVQSRPFVMNVNGAEPQEFLNGACYYDLYATKNYVNLKPVVNKKEEKEDNNG